MELIGKERAASGAPTITLDGHADGNFPATDGTASAAHLTGRRMHRQVPKAGHSLAHENPEAFAEAVLDLINPDRPPYKADRVTPPGQ
jgi:pimeloyl-ACP methyl ester carboxylesterase